MGAMRMLTSFLSSFLCFYFLLRLIKLFHKVWWTPLYIQHKMRRQGIKGPSYKFIHGNTKEIFNMRKESLIRPMDISHKIFPRILPHIYSWFNIYGRSFLNWYGSKAQLVVTEPELIKEILHNRDGAYGKIEVQAYFKKLVGDGLALAEGEKWARQRKLANHVFNGESLKSMIPAIIASAEMMLEKWTHHEGKEIEVFEEFRLFTSDVISRTAFGSSYLEGKKIFEMLLKLSLISSRNDFKIRFPGISKFIKNIDDIESEELEKGIRESIMEMIKNREKKAMTGDVDGFGSDYLGLLVKANHDADEEKWISVEDIIEECKTFYFTGQKTTNSMLAWTVFLLAINTDWQEEARKEVLKLFGQQNPNPDGIARLKTMNMIINESLRLYPPAISIARSVKREVTLGNFIIPANIDLFIPTLALQHDPNIWGEDVHIFKPHRFSEGVANATNNSVAAFLPFGLGPRACVGYNFAMIEVKIALSMILQRYTFTLSPAYVHSPFQMLTLRPQHGVQIILHAL